jgi:hypothetical protein
MTIGGGPSTFAEHKVKIDEREAPRPSTSADGKTLIGESDAKRWPAAVECG